MSGSASRELDEATVAALLPERPARGHKGTFGRLLVVAGSLDYAGAALLVARAAGRTGAGLVTLAVPASLQPVFSGRVLEATTLALPESAPGVVEPVAALEVLLDRDHDALVVGPGLRPGLATLELVEAIVASGAGAATGAGQGSAPAALLDAEALNALATRDGWWRRAGRPLVLTPHPGELRRLLGADPEAAREFSAVGAATTAGAETEGRGALDLAGDERRLAAARRCAERWGQVLVLKGARSVIAAPDGSCAVAPFENPGLASGGTGDVLAGTIGALLAQRLAPWDAARVGVYLHGLAGETVRERFGDAGPLASDLPDEIARARRRLATLRGDGRRAGRVGFVPEESS